MPDWKTILRAAACGAYRHSGALAVHETLARRRGRRALAILVFHRVTDVVPEGSLTVGTARFRRLCQLLARRFSVVPLGEIFRLLRTGEDMPPRTVAVTFDDCYYDNLAAARVLAEFRLPATFFVPTGYVGTDHVFPWDEGLPRMANLTWNDIREMANLGFEIGSHTVSHADLGAIDTERARQELSESREKLRRELGRPPRWFAYPFGGLGNLRPEFVPLIAEVGYEGAVSAYGGFVRPGCDDRVLPREAVPDFLSLAHLEVFLSGCLDWFYERKKARLPVPPDPTPASYPVGGQP